MSGARRRRGPLRRIPFPAGSRLFQRMFTRLGCPGRPPHFVVEFYPYAGLVQTIKLREDTACVRLSDLLRRAPLAVQEAAAAILLGRLYRRRPPRALDRTYREYVLARATRRRIDRLRSRRAQRAARPARGDCYDLEPLFDRLNGQYFESRLARPRLGWSLRPWRAQLGCYDPALDQIVISSRFDRRTAPPYVVEYLLFHEMLHVKHPLRRAACGLRAHSPAFRQEEKRYADYERARRYLLGV